MEKEDGFYFLNSNLSKLVDGLNLLVKATADGLAEIARSNRTTCLAPAISCSNNSVTITSSTEGASIYYTTDGSVPTRESSLYSNAFSIEATVQVRAIAIKLDMNDSAITTETCQLTPTAATPTITNDTASSKIVMACATEGATIRYTTDGSAPTAASTAYSAGISYPVSETTYKAKAFKEGYIASEVASFTYTPASE